MLFVSGVVIWLQADAVASAEEPVIIVIDPGHGGENLGAQYDGYTEKDMTMAVAKAMKEELEQYENVVVYLTHDADVDVHLKERAEFAKDRNADFLYSLHFNASVNHNLFGSEVWIPASGNFYVKGYQFAEIQLQQFENIGLYSRGIKTKLNDDGKEYYGILRFCTDMDIPSALIEHCHMDQEGVDYSEYKKIAVEIPESVVMPDITAPETAGIKILSIDDMTGEVTVRADASESDSFILYYKYSFDVQAESNCINIDAIKAPEEKQDSQITEKIYEEIRLELPDTSYKEDLARFDKIELIILILIISSFIWLIFLAMIKMLKSEPRNKQRKKR